MARTLRNQDNRDKLLEQGVALLSEYGYHGTGLKLILDAVKVPKGSFYNYFESKEQFVAEIIRRYSQAQCEEWAEQIAQSEEPPLKKIETLCRQALEQLDALGCKKGCLLGDLAAEIGGQSQSCQEAMQQAYRNWQQLITPLLEDAQQEGSIRNDLAVEDLAAIFWNQWEGGLLRMKIEGSTRGLQKSLDQLLHLLLKP